MTNSYANTFSTLSKLSNLELARWMKANLNLNQVTELWQNVFNESIENFNACKEKPRIKLNLSQAIALFCKEEIKKYYFDKTYSELVKFCKEVYQSQPESSKVVLELIEEAAKTNATKLDLSCQALTSLPNSLFELKNLRILKLTGNALDIIGNKVS